MIFLKYASFFRFENGINLDVFLDVARSNRLPDELGLAESGFGWCPNIEPSIYQSPNHQSYCIGRFSGKLKSVPKELMQRRITAEVRKLEGMGTKVTREYIGAIEGQFHQELSKNIDPERIDGYVIVTASGDLIITARKRNDIARLRIGLEFLLRAHDLNFKPNNLALSRARITLLVKNIDRLSFDIGEIAGKSGRHLVRLIPGETEKALFNQSIEHLDFERLTVNKEDMLSVAFTKKGEIHDIKFGEQFESEWREYGDGEESELLDQIRTGLWLDQMMLLRSSVESDIDLLSCSTESTRVVQATG